MRRNNKEIEKYRDLNWSSEEIGNNGLFWIRFESYTLKVIASDGGGWDHVSVSLPNRCPNWKEMCFVKDLFFDEEEAAIQYHPPKSEYVNNHPYCLHLWRNQDQEMALPPSSFVGIKDLGVIVK